MRERCPAMEKLGKLKLEKFNKLIENWEEVLKKSWSKSSNETR